MKRLKPTIWLSFGLASLTLALALTGYVLGLMPDGYRIELESRAKVAEALAVQLAGAANRNDGLVLQETLSSVVKRNADVNSGAFRRNDGTIVLSAGEHESHWVKSEDGESTPTHVSVPLFGPDGQQGTIELSFEPASTTKRIFGVPATLIMFLGFLMAFGFIGYFLMLRRTLRQLDPGRVIPERVQKAFDTLNEGVIILDEKERILLVNEAFAEVYGPQNNSLLGDKINTLSWRMVDGSAQAGGYPWHTAIREGREMRKDLLSLRTADGNIHNFNVNATVIADDKQRTIGAIVTLSDMTNTKRNEEQLEKLITKLQQTENHAEHQNNELAYLISNDSLSGCLNRRTFFQKLEADLEALSGSFESFAVLMVNIDHFDKFNRENGTATADSALAGVAEIVRKSVNDAGYVGRYSGDQLCIALPHAGVTQAKELAKGLLHKVSDGMRKLLGGGTDLTVSIGIACGSGEGFAMQTMINQADQALDHAKAGGRNKAVSWNSNLSSDEPDELENMADDDVTLDDKDPVQFAQRVDHGSEPITENVAVSGLSGFLQGVERTLSLAQVTGKQTAIFQISLDSWSYLTEALGDAGSQSLLRSIKHQAGLVLRERDEMTTISNTGELLVNITEVDNRMNLDWIMKQVLDNLRLPVNVNGKDVYVACNAGIATFPGDGGTASVLVRNAASAMRRSREENCVDGYKFYSAEMTLSSQERLEIEYGIRETLQRDEFELFFQPIVDLETGALAAAESLLRCNNKHLKNIYMDKIIGVAEKSALISEIDMWVLNASLNQMQAWCDQGLSLPKISINISATQFTNVEFMDRVFDRIKAVRFSPTRVQIEVTETAKIADVNLAAPQLKRLQQLGVSIALDDFGTGQASLTYLQRLHPDVIKIDRSFVSGVNSNHANATLVSAVTVMAHCLGLKVVVEGVEVEEECEFLRQTRCDEMQGYLISRPMPANDMGQWMDSFVSEHGASKHLNQVRPLELTDTSEEISVEAA